MAKISLCLIAGNVEEYIERCLTSFAPIADEICIVRAIGNLVPDKTIELAQSVAAAAGCRAGISFRWSEYRNKPAHQSWPHLDDFAAARNQSFEMATGDYIFWCDTDDVLKSGAEFVREHANRNGYPVFMFPYDIFGRGVDFTRERMVLRGSGKWIFPVHECFSFNNPKAQGVQDDRVIVQHLPSTHKTGSNDRNLRIMEAIPEKEMTPGLWYHLHGEHLGKGHVKESIDTAKKALACKDLGKPERYEIFLNMGRVAKDAHTARMFFHQAYSVDPCRREALGLLTCSALDYQLYDDAMAYARQMLATTKPENESWNDRKAAYEWLGVEIYTQALRMKGEHAEAERCRVALLENSGGPIISLIHATRGRPRQASIARKMWLDLAERPEAIEHIFVIDADDKESIALTRMHHIVVPAGGGCVHAWNSGALMAKGDILIQMSDDWMPLPRWDTIILERFQGGTDCPQSVGTGPDNALGTTRSTNAMDQPRVLAISDGHRTDDLLCMAIMTKAYFNQDYFMFHPWFFGVYSDNWFTREAYRRGQVIDAKDLVFTHNHPVFDKGVKIDVTYRRQNAPERYKEGKAIMERLMQFQDWSTVPGWFNYWQLYQQIAKRLKDGDVVAEVGVWLGRSIIYLAQECQRLGKKVKFIAIDNFKGEENQPVHEATVAQAGGSIYKLFARNIEQCGVADVIDVWVGDSAEEAVEVDDGTLAFCFIDAAHDYDSVRRDIAAWLPKVKEGGILAGHDAEWEDVNKAVKEAFPTPGGAVISGSIWIYPVPKKGGDASCRSTSQDTSKIIHVGNAAPTVQPAGVAVESGTVTHSP